MVGDYLVRIAQLQAKLAYVQRRRSELQYHYKMEINRIESLQSKLNTEIDISFRELKYKEFSPPKEYKRFEPDYVDGPLNLTKWYENVCEEPLCNDFYPGADISQKRPHTS